MIDSVKIASAHAGLTMAVQSQLAAVARSAKHMAVTPSEFPAEFADAMENATISVSLRDLCIALGIDPDERKAP